MSNSNFYAYDDELEDYQDSELAWTAGDLHVTELGYSHDVFARQNELLDEFPVSGSDNNPYPDALESIDILQNMTDTPYMEQTILNHESNFATSASFSLDSELAPPRDDCMLSPGAHMGVQYYAEPRAPSQTTQGSSLSFNYLNRELTETKRSYVSPVATPPSPPPPQLSQLVTESAVSTAKEVSHFTQGQDNVPTQAYDSSGAGHLFSSFHHLNFTGDPSCHPGLTESFNDDFTSCYICECSRHQRITAQPGLHQLQSNSVYQRTKQERPVVMERSQSTQTLGFRSWKSTDMSRSVSLGSMSVQLQSATCTTCGQTYKGKYCKRNLQRHTQSKHNEGEPPVYICQAPGCGRTYKRSDALRVHERKGHSELT